MPLFMPLFMPSFMPLFMLLFDIGQVMRKSEVANLLSLDLSVKSYLEVAILDSGASSSQPNH